MVKINTYALVILNNTNGPTLQLRKLIEIQRSVNIDRSSIHQGHINLYATNNMASTYIKQKLTKL